MNNKQNLFWPIYKNLEKEFKELSFYINIDDNQLQTYSIKIAELIIRTVSECENIAKALVKREFGEDFKKIFGSDERNVYYTDLINKLNEKFELEFKTVEIIYNFQSISKKVKTPFVYNKKKKDTDSDNNLWTWYEAYNKMKHDRMSSYNEGKIGNFFDALAALFILNVYFKPDNFYYGYNGLPGLIDAEINGLSDIFKCHTVLYFNHTDDNQYRNDKSSIFFIKKNINSMQIYSLYEKELSKINKRRDISGRIIDEEPNVVGFLNKKF